MQYRTAAVLLVGIRCFYTPRAALLLPQVVAVVVLMAVVMTATGCREADAKDGLDATAAVTTAVSPSTQ